MTVTNNLGINYEADLQEVINDLYFVMILGTRTIHVTPTDAMHSATVDFGGEYPSIDLMVTANRSDFGEQCIKRGDLPVVDGRQYRVISVEHGAEGVSLGIALARTGQVS